MISFFTNLFVGISFFFNLLVFNVEQFGGRYFSNFYLYCFLEYTPYCYNDSFF